MTNSMHFLILSICYIAFLNFLFWHKQHINTPELNIFGYLLKVNLVGLVLELLCIYGGLYFDLDGILNILFNRLYLLYLILFCMLFMVYVIAVSLGMNRFRKEEKKIIRNAVILGLAAGVVTTLLPLSIHADEYFYSSGPAITSIVVFSAIALAVSLVYMFKNFKSVKMKNYLPLFLLLIGLTLASIVQQINPNYTLITVIESFVLFIMYHTIENPDMRMIAQLNLAKEQADKANQAKSDFLSNMSHEIRTPLNAIVGFGQALSEEDLPPQAMSEVKDIMMASDNLLEIVNGILDISKIESGKLEIINKDYSFKKIFDEVVTLAKGRLGEKPLEFRVAYDESIPPVLFGDYSRIKEIMINLLTNAIKYTHEGYIELKASSVIKDDICRIIISVEDSGIGIKQENINKLFTKFERLGVEEHATIEGTGLGLAITKKLLDLMNGQIVVQSVYGKGSRFTVAIDQKISVGHKLEDTASLDLTELETMDFSSKKVLVVDDNVINLKVAHRLLQEYKVQITEVQSGQAAIDLINAGNTYDLILMDDMMPKMSGVQTLQKLKTIPGFQMKVVALTANAITGMREKYLADGFDEYLAKPISKKELAKIIKKMLSN